MAHQVINDRVVVDWTTGDPEGDRITLLAAYRDFIKELRTTIRWSYGQKGLVVSKEIMDVFRKWNVDTENQIDEVPRVWIKRP